MVCRMYLLGVSMISLITKIDQEKIKEPSEFYYLRNKITNKIEEVKGILVAEQQNGTSQAFYLKS